MSDLHSMFAPDRVLMVTEFFLMVPTLLIQNLYLFSTCRLRFFKKIRFDLAVITWKKRTFSVWILFFKVASFLVINVFLVWKTPFLSTHFLFNASFRYMVVKISLNLWHFPKSYKAKQIYLWKRKSFQRANIK